MTEEMSIIGSEAYSAAKELLDIYFGERETPEKHEA